jgi:hypothetical protein
VIIQKEVPNIIKDSRHGLEIITSVFSFGPIRVVVIANIPPDKEKKGSSYVRIELMPSAEWYEFRKPADTPVEKEYAQRDP